MVMCAPTSTPSPTSTPLSHVDPLSHTIFANLFGFLFVSFAMYDNIRIYKPLAARVGPLFDIFRVGCLGGAGATESGILNYEIIICAQSVCARCSRSRL